LIREGGDWVEVPSRVENEKFIWLFQVAQFLE
jgi:hypothetical protein